tara:strand:+ start:242 stop:403 length:162 start_codon:yes stop_codon:yes gene_type:complete
LINKTFSQLNAERAARRARPIKKIERLGEITRGLKLQAASALKRTQLKGRIKT